MTQANVHCRLRRNLIPVWMKTLALLATMLLPLAGCQSRDDRPVVAASIWPLASLVEQIVGPAAQVRTLLPPGANPYIYTMDPQQAQELSQAVMLVRVGSGLDDWAIPPAAATSPASQPAMPMLAMESVQTTQPSSAEDASSPGYVMTLSHRDRRQRQAMTADPHLWLDLDLTARFVEALTPQLAQRFPDHRAGIEQRGKALAAELRSLDQEFRRQLWGCPNKSLMTYHRIINRLADRYSLQVVAQVIDVPTSPTGSASNQQIVAGIAAVREHGVSVLYVEPFFKDQQGLQLIQQRTQVKVMVLNTLGPPGLPGTPAIPAKSGGKNYQSLLRANINAILQGQTPERPATIPADDEPEPTPKKR